MAKAAAAAVPRRGSDGPRLVAQAAIQRWVPTRWWRRSWPRRVDWPSTAHGFRAAAQAREAGSTVVCRSAGTANTAVRRNGGLPRRSAHLQISLDERISKSDVIWSNSIKSKLAKKLGFT